MPSEKKEKGRVMPDVRKSLSAPSNINKQSAAVSNTDRGEINQTEKGEERR